MRSPVHHQLASQLAFWANQSRGLFPIPIHSHEARFRIPSVGQAESKAICGEPEKTVDIGQPIRERPVRRLVLQINNCQAHAIGIRGENAKKLPVRRQPRFVVLVITEERFDRQFGRKAGCKQTSTDQGLDPTR